MGRGVIQMFILLHICKMVPKNGERECPMNCPRRLWMPSKENYVMGIHKQQGQRRGEVFSPKSP